MPQLPIQDPPAICVHDASVRYGVPASAIRAILATEGGGSGVVHLNKDGSKDLGWMQINTKWLPYFSRYGIRYSVLLNDACVNVAVGTWILHHYYSMFHDWPQAVQAYNVGPVSVKKSELSGLAYATKVIVRWNKIAGAPATGQPNVRDETRLTDSSQQESKPSTLKKRRFVLPASALHRRSSEAIDVAPTYRSGQKIALADKLD